MNWLVEKGSWNVIWAARRVAAPIANPLLIREASRLRKMLAAFVSGAAGFVVTTPSSLHIVPVASPRCTSAHAMAVSEPPEAKTTRPWQQRQALLDEAAAKRAAFEALSAKSVDDTKEQRVAEEAAAKRAAFEAQVAAEKEKKAVIAEEMKAKGFTIVEAKPEPEPEPEPEGKKDTDVQVLAHALVERMKLDEINVLLGQHQLPVEGNKADKLARLLPCVTVQSVLRVVNP